MHALISLLFLTILLRPARSVYFYIEGTTPKCFYEELRKDTLVVGHYSAEEYSPQTNSYVKNDALGIFISVDVSMKHFSLLKIQLAFPMARTP
jgi:p24 family protein alpha